MKKIALAAALIIGALTLPTSCIEEYEPQNGNVTNGQAGSAPGSFDNFVSGITTSLNGQSNYSNSPAEYAFDFGMPSMFIMHDVMGQDMVSNGTGTDWFSSWYMYDQALGPSYAICQVPWTVYYAWIKNCNTVIAMAGTEPSEERKSGAGIAPARPMRKCGHSSWPTWTRPRNTCRATSARTTPRPISPWSTV